MLAMTGFVAVKITRRGSNKASKTVADEMAAGEVGYVIMTKQEVEATDKLDELDGKWSDPWHDHEVVGLANLSSSVVEQVRESRIPEGVSVKDMPADVLLAMFVTACVALQKQSRDSGNPLQFSQILSMLRRVQAEENLYAGQDVLDFITQHLDINLPEGIENAEEEQKEKG